ncbi:patatin-like phospholipase family protein [Nafulsella turpanensis]|uniref:patatin-like phospholipase family protein n=1 Tax=Nafulsella turpanensis TaxID=1265690 RepID=UPI00034A3DD3|nr:patatin-like phospholipase family protein [Nafulsella turpanensis]
MKNVRLVLGSGSARGIAHIGVIEELEKEGYTIKEVVGCSMGALVGGIYAAGCLPQYKEWLLKLSKLDVFRLFDFTFSVQGLIKGERVFLAIEELIGDQQIDDFSIPFTAVAVDVLNREEVYYRRGSLFKALRASIAIPTLFTPVPDGGALLVDGGVLNPLPLNLVNKEEGDIVVAVNLNGKPAPCAPQPLTVENKEKAAYLRMLEAFRTQILKMDTKAEEKAAYMGFFALLNTSYELTQDKVAELMVHIHQPDIMVTISRDSCGVFEYYRAEELIEEGRKAFHKARQLSQ